MHTYKISHHPLTGEPIHPIGFHPVTGRPVWPIMGGSQHAGDEPSEEDIAAAQEQDRLSRIAAREKAQGQRAGKREILESLGFATAEEAEAYVKKQREEEAARLSEAERREAAATERENKAVERERLADSKARTADLARALVTRGCAGDNLGDAELLLGATVPTDASPEAIAEAADALKVRRPELFDTTAVTPPAVTPPALPTGTPSGRSAPPAPKFGASGLAEAERRGYIKS